MNWTKMRQKREADTKSGAETQRNKVDKLRQNKIH